MDLLPALAAAEVCPAEGTHCWPPGVSASLHRAGDGEVVLPPGTTTGLYLRVPKRAVLDLQIMRTGASIALSARTDDGTEIPLEAAAGSPAAGGWETVKVSLAAVAGQIVRVRITILAADGAGVRVGGAGLVSQMSPATVGAASLTARSRRPNVVLYVIDTVRADHVGCYGYGRPTTPAIDRFAGGAVLYARAVAQSSWTLPSTASLLTGLTPPHHGATDPDHGIRADAPALAESLARAGYQTAAFATNYLGGSAFGHARGFASFRLYREEGGRRLSVYLPSSALERRVGRWLARHARSPFFLYVHASDPHAPYRPCPRHARPFLAPGTTYAAAIAVADRLRPFFLGNERWGLRPTPLAAADVAVLRDLYDGDLRQADEAFGLLVDELTRRGLLDDTLMILTSDHGEEFLDHGGVEHGQTLFGEVLRVPLVLRWPGGAGGGTRVDTLVQQVDVMPTVLAAAGLPIPSELDGVSLEGKRTEDDVEAYSALRLAGRDLDAVTTSSWKVVRDRTEPGAPEIALYDLVRDPDERADAVSGSPVRLGYGTRRLGELSVLQGRGGKVDPAVVDRLRALGYTAD